MTRMNNESLYWNLISRRRISTFFAATRLVLSCWPSGTVIIKIKMKIKWWRRLTLIFFDEFPTKCLRHSYERKKNMFLHALAEVNIYHLIFGPCTVYSGQWSGLIFSRFHIQTVTIHCVWHCIQSCKSITQTKTFPQNSSSRHCQILFFIVIKSVFFRLPWDHNRFDTHSRWREKELKSHTHTHTQLPDKL